MQRFTKVTWFPGDICCLPFILPGHYHKNPTRMQWQKPSPQEVFHAIDVYLNVAYPGKGPATTIQSRLDALRMQEPKAFYESTSLEREANQNPPQKYALRLGNHHYPHMKLVIEPTPDALGHMFRADTHDKHIRPDPKSKEYALFCQMMEQNQKLAERIEFEWEKAGLCTFKRYLREDLARRAGGASPLL